MAPEPAGSGATVGFYRNRIVASPKNRKDLVNLKMTISSSATLQHTILTPKTALTTGVPMDSSVLNVD